MTEVITKTTLESNTHENILSVLDTRSNITDPRNPNSIENLRQFVYDSDPFAKAINFKDFPYIICKFPTLLYSNVSTNGKVKTIKWSQSITVRQVRDGSANTRTDIGRTDMMSMGDDLNTTFNNATIKQQLSDLRMHKMNLIKLNVDEFDLQQQSVYEWTYELTYEERIQVSD